MAQVAKKETQCEKLCCENLLGNRRGVRQENLRLTAPFLMPLVCVPHITALLEESEDVTTAACQVVDVNVALRSMAVRVQTIYQKDDILAVIHNRRREIPPFCSSGCTRSEWWTFCAAKSIPKARQVIH